MTDAHDHDAHEHAHEHQHTLSYEDAIAAFRADKDEFFKTSHGSPIPAAEREAFDGLPYYPVDADLRFDDLALQPYTGSEPVAFEIPTSDGRLRPAARAGVFRFPLGGEERTLTAYTFAGGRQRVPVRALPRRDQRARDLRRRALHGRRRRGRRHVLDRLQPRLPPVVRVRPEVLVPADAGGEPAPGAR